MSMADKPGVIWFDGKLIPWADAKIHVLTHGLHYGTGVFEGVRAYQTEHGTAIFRLADHTHRLLSSLKILNMKIDYDYETIFEAQRTVVRDNKLNACYIRPICFYGDDQLGLSVKNSHTHVAIAAWEWGAYLGKDSLTNGITAHISSFTRNHVNSSMSKAKVTGHYINSTLAHQEAELSGYDEAIMLDSQGHVAEGSGENIFLVYNGTILTPMISSCLDGITRETIIRLARDMDIPLIERNITRDELYIADEVFFTGTAAEVTPIRNIDNREIGDGKPGAITKLLQSKFFECVHGEDPQYSSWLTYI